MEEGRIAVKEIGGKVVKYVYRLWPAFYYQHRRTNEDFLMTTVGVVATMRGRERVKAASNRHNQIKDFLKCTPFGNYNVVFNSDSSINPFTTRHIFCFNLAGI